MFGYACDETSDFLPATIALSNKTMEIYDNLRQRNMLPGCHPDAKCQYTIEYKHNKPFAIKTILISMQHSENTSISILEHYVKTLILLLVKTHLPELSYLFESKYDVLINPTGKFVIGGPEGDTGLTGRKIIVDTYGGRCPHGGGAFSGKDPSKVDRSAAYAARYIAKNMVAAGIATEATIQLSYAIGKPEPLSICVDAKSAYSNEHLVEMIKEIFPIRPYDIIENLDLKNPHYYQTAIYGHFGKRVTTDTIFPWEKLDKINEIKKYFNINE